MIDVWKSKQKVSLLTSEVHVQGVITYKLHHLALRYCDSYRIMQYTRSPGNVGGLSFEETEAPTHLA